MNFFNAKINIFSIPPFVISFLSLSLGLFVFMKNKKMSQNRAYFLLAISLFVWLFFASILSSLNNENLAIFISKMAFVGVTFIPITFYHFVISFLGFEEQRNLSNLFYVLGRVFILALFSSNLYLSGIFQYF